MKPDDFIAEIGSQLAEFILHSLPLAVAIADEDIRIQAINQAAGVFFCTAANEVHMKKCGDLLKCIHASKPNGCGFTPACPNCTLRSSICLALDGRTISRSKGKFHVWKNNTIATLTLLITAAPIHYKNQTMVVVVIEDISLVTELEGLLPICCSCHKIRNEDGEWIPIVKYVQSHSEADFTHDYCPECIALVKRNHF